MFCRQDLEQITWWAGREGSEVDTHLLHAGCRAASVSYTISFSPQSNLVGFMTITHVSGELAVAQRH